MSPSPSEQCPNLSTMLHLSFDLFFHAIFSFCMYQFNLFKKKILKFTAAIYPQPQSNTLIWKKYFICIEDLKQSRTPKKALSQNVWLLSHNIRNGKSHAWWYNFILI